MKIMTQEDKELLLKDLSTRTPYSVKVSLQTGKRELTGVLDAVYPSDERVIVDNLSEAIAPINVRTGGFLIEKDNVKPFLRPMSGMTEEEKKELASKFDFYVKLSTWREDDKIVNLRPYGVGNHLSTTVDNLKIAEVLNWLNAHHFDYRGLIEKGLALEAPEGMYETEK